MKSPDLIIDNKKIEVKKPKLKFSDARKNARMINGSLFLREDDDSIIEDLSKHIERGFNQRKPDIVAIDVIHLEKRDILGFNSKWLDISIDLEKALRNAINYHKRGIVLLFKIRPESTLGTVIRCKKKNTN